VAYEGNYAYNQGQTHTISTISGTGIDMSFQWDLNGNMTAHNDNINSLNRYLCWDEENRLMAVKDQNYLSAYVYDAAGERVWKLTGEVTQMKISGVGTIDVASLSNKTLYVSPYVVYNQQGYSKHYYAGAERVSSRIGGGTLYGLQHPINDTVTPITDEYPELSTHLWDMLERSFSGCLDLITEYITYEPYMVSIQESASQNNAENNWYIYHSDHLGSSSFLTDASGDPTQHLQYLPFGENYIEQRVTTDYYTPYTFSAKERDLETGYSYFGARYYDPNVSVWLSVDPMADKYPSMSAFMYCAGNPVMLVDPDGRKLDPYLLFNGATGELSIYDDNDTPDDYSDDLLLSTHKAHNNTSKKSKGKWEDGSYNMLDKNSRYTHKDKFESDKKTPQDSPNGRYGKGGIYRAKSFVETITKVVRTGMAIHAGRENKGFLSRVTNGCIRTTAEAMLAIDKAIADYGPLQRIIVQNNRQSSTSSQVNSIKPSKTRENKPKMPHPNIPLNINRPDALNIVLPNFELKLPQ